MTPKEKIAAALLLADPTRAHAACTRADLAAVANILLETLTADTEDTAAQHQYLSLADLCRNTCVSYPHAKAVLAQQGVHGKIRTAQLGAHTRYHLGDFRKILNLTPYAPRRRRRKTEEAPLRA